MLVVDCRDFGRRLLLVEAEAVERDVGDLGAIGAILKHVLDKSLDVR